MIELQGQQGIEQGQQVTDPSTQQSDPAVSQEMAQFLAEEPSAQQGQLPMETSNQPQIDYQKQYNEIQSAYSRSQAEKKAMEQQIDLMRQQQQLLYQQMQPQQQIPDRDIDPLGYMQWQINQSQQQVLRQAEQIAEQKISNLVQQATEMQWRQTHPQVDVNAVKDFARLNGIAEWNLDGAYKLMTYPQQMQTVAQQSINKTINNFRQPQNTIPIRSASVPQANTYDSEKLMREVANDPSILNRMTPEFRSSFMKEVASIQNALQ